MTADAVVSVPLARCHAARSCAACVALQDPYCAWSVDHAACTALNELGVAGVDGVVINAAAFAQSVSTGTHRTCGPVGGVETQQEEPSYRVLLDQLAGGHDGVFRRVAENCVSLVLHLHSNGPPTACLQNVGSFRSEREMPDLPDQIRRKRLTDGFVEHSLLLVSMRQQCMCY